MDDHELLKRFVRDNSNSAFAELVHRHIDMVYSSARRQVHSAQIAEDVCQRVFMRLARKAATIRDGEAIAGWLLTTTRFMAVDFIRADARRRRHESEAAAMKNEAHTPVEPVWDAIQPMLDEFVSQLKPSDRDAVALRYFQRRSLVEVARALQVTPAAAQKRVERALNRLRELFAGRGVTTTDEALSLALAANVCLPAPKTLAGVVAQSVLSATTTAKGGLSIMAALNTKLTIAVAAALVLAAPMLYVGIQSTGGQGSNSRAAQVPNGGNDTAWEPAFRKSYSLKADEVVRQVSPPFIAEREDFWRSQFGNAFVATGATPKAPTKIPEIPPPASMVLSSEDARFESISTLAQGQYIVAQLLQTITGVFPQETDIPRDLLTKEVSGDWVVRQEATLDAKMNAVARQMISRGASLKLRDVQREVIIVSGVYQPAKWPKTDNVQRMYGDRIAQLFLYQNSDRINPGNHWIAKNRRVFLDRLGSMVLRPMIIEAQLGKEEPVVMLSLHDPAQFIKAPDADDPAIVDSLLKLISEQTSLKFTQAQRTVPTWTLVK